MISWWLLKGMVGAQYYFEYGMSWPCKLETFDTAYESEGDSALSKFQMSILAFRAGWV